MPRIQVRASLPRQCSIHNYLLDAPAMHSLYPLWPVLTLRCYSYLSGEATVARQIAEWSLGRMRFHSVRSRLYQLRTKKTLFEVFPVLCFVLDGSAPLLNPGLRYWRRASFPALAMSLLLLQFTTQTIIWYHNYSTLSCLTIVIV